MNPRAPRHLFQRKSPDSAGISPSHERLLTESSETPQEMVKLRAKFYGEAEALEASASPGGAQTRTMKRAGYGHVWEADLPTPSKDTHRLKLSFKDACGRVASDEVRLAVGRRTERQSEKRDQDNAVEAWLKHVLLGSQLGPDKNGKKW